MSLTDHGVAQSPLFYVEVIGGEKDGVQFEIGPQGLLVGRSATCDVIFRDREVSRRHAYFYTDQSACYVEDLGSKNGVWVNAVRAKKERLMDGDTVETGPVRFVLHAGQAGQMQAPWLDAERPARRPGPSGRTETAAAAGFPFKHTLAASSLVFGVLSYLHWAFGAGGVLLALLAMMELSREDHRTGLALALGGVIIGAVGAGMNIWFAGLAPKLREKDELIARSQCRDNMAEVWRALSSYRNSHGGRYPSSLDELVKASLLDARRTRCPGCQLDGEKACTYLFRRPGGRGPASRTSVVLCDADCAWHQNRGGWVLRNTGAIEWVPEEQFRDLLTQLGTGSAAQSAGGQGSAGR